jgi:hypothetical protein
VTGLPGFKPVRWPLDFYGRSIDIGRKFRLISSNGMK